MILQDFQLLTPSFAGHGQVTQCYVGVLDFYANPNTLTMFDMSEVQTYKLIDCDKAHYPKEIIQ